MAEKTGLGFAQPASIEISIGQLEVVRSEEGKAAQVYLRSGFKLARRELRILASPPGKQLEALRGNPKGQLSRFASMINGKSVLCGGRVIVTMWKSPTITRGNKKTNMSESEGLMPPGHPGEVLREDSMKPLDLTVNRLVLELHVPATRIGKVVHERPNHDGDRAAPGTILQHGRRVLAEPPKFL